MTNQELANNIKQEEIIKATEMILRAIREDTNREGLVKTPERVAKAYEEIFNGYFVDTKALINKALFDVEYDQMVLVKDIKFYSMCEHHILPFFGKAHVAYLPREKVIGLSKIPRIVEMFAHRLQVQERMTQQIATFIQETIRPLGVAVVIEASHLCMMMRGVRNQDATMTTSAMLGGFRTHLETRLEFLNRIS